MTVWLKEHATPVLIGIALAFLPLLYFVYSGVSWRPLNPHEHLVQNGLAYLFLVLFSYYNFTVFVPRWYLNKRYLRYFTITIGCILGAVYLPYRIEQWAFFRPPAEHTLMAWTKQIFWEEMMLNRPDFRMHNMPGKDLNDFPGPPDFSKDSFPPNDKMPPEFSQTRANGRSLSLILPAKLAIFFLLGSVSSLISILIQATARLRKVESEQTQAELRQLKAQIQPHFLFNTLNSIYALAVRKDEHTADTIVQLSEFLRYVITDSNREHVPLTAELSYIKNYISLQEARLRDSVQVDYRQEGHFDGVLIAPLILFSFVENAFKYGVSPEEESVIEIHLEIENNALSLFVRNNKVEINQMEASTGIGLLNTRERLRLLYPDRHELIIDDIGKHFKVKLQLELI